MALRLIEMVLQKKDALEVHELLKEHKVLDHRQVQLLGGEVLVRILLDAEQNESILDLLDKKYTNEHNRAVILPVEATLPRAEPVPPTTSVASPEHIGREELYEDIKDAAECSHVYLAMLVLSTIVVTIGLLNNSVAIIIGAMVIAPMIGPSMALGLGTALGDFLLLRHALKTVLVGIAIIMGLSVIIGILVHVDPGMPEVVSRTKVKLSDVVLALASGCAGALAFTTGVSETMIGVMVAVALLPPLATFGLLLGSNYVALSLESLSLFLMNLICVNFAGVTTFLIQGIHPLGWVEKKQATKATYIAIGLWGGMLALLVVLVMII
ncbi:TPA: TIGR00341 family protein [Legionella bozemanae]|uniref:TIGR00341 family protein n=1 Tax=Legionella bozemanae TaxID=447 RepID=UPI00399CB5FB